MAGFGTYRFADGATYEGVMQDDWPNGEGTARYSNGGVYVGRWRNGKYEVIYPNNRFVFRANMAYVPLLFFLAQHVSTLTQYMPRTTPKCRFSSQFTLYPVNSRSLVPRVRPLFDVGKGYGILKYPTGAVYEGGWHEGQRSGKGKIKYKVKRSRSFHLHASGCFSV